MNADNIVFHANDGLAFERDDVTGDVTIHLEGMRVKVDAWTWISAVSAMTCHGDEANHDAFKIMHTGIGGSV